MARAKLAADCKIPKIFPCAASCASLEARLVIAGEANELPIEKNAMPMSKNGQSAARRSDERHGK